MNHLNLSVACQSPSGRKDSPAGSPAKGFQKLTGRKIITRLPASIEPNQQGSWLDNFTSNGYSSGHKSIFQEATEGLLKKIGSPAGYVHQQPADLGGQLQSLDENGQHMGEWAWQDRLHEVDKGMAQLREAAWHPAVSTASVDNTAALQNLSLGLREAVNTAGHHIGDASLANTSMLSLNTKLMAAASGIPNLPLASISSSTSLRQTLDALKSQSQELDPSYLGSGITSAPIQLETTTDVMKMVLSQAEQIASADVMQDASSRLSIIDGQLQQAISHEGAGIVTSQGLLDTTHKLERASLEMQNSINTLVPNDMTQGTRDAGSSMLESTNETLHGLSDAMSVSPLGKDAATQLSQVANSLAQVADSSTPILEVRHSEAAHNLSDATSDLKSFLSELPVGPGASTTPSIQLSESIKDLTHSATLVSSQHPNTTSTTEAASNLADTTSAWHQHILASGEPGQQGAYNGAAHITNTLQLLRSAAGKAEQEGLAVAADSLNNVTNTLQSFSDKALQIEQEGLTVAADSLNHVTNTLQLLSDKALQIEQEGLTVAADSLDNVTDTLQSFSDKALKIEQEGLTVAADSLNHFINTLQPFSDKALKIEQEGLTVAADSLSIAATKLQAFSHNAMDQVLHNGSGADAASMRLNQIASQMWTTVDNSLHASSKGLQSASSDLVTAAVSLLKHQVPGTTTIQDPPSMSNPLLESALKLNTSHPVLETAVPSNEGSSEQIGEINIALKQILETVRNKQDPVEAAESLKDFMLQFKGRYGDSMGHRIDATVSKLQNFINSKVLLPDAEVKVMEGSQSVSGMVEKATVSPVDGAILEPEYHNYLTDGILGNLNKVQEILVQKPGADILGTGNRQEQQLYDAANHLTALSQQLGEVQSMYSSKDPEEHEAMATIASQIAAIASKISSEVSSFQAGGHEVNASVVSSEGSVSAVASDIQETVSGLMDNIHAAVVADSSLRDLLVDVKRLGESIVVSMDNTWSGAPPAARLAAYVTALAGTFFLLRMRAPSLEGKLPLQDKQNSFPIQSSNTTDQGLDNLLSGIDSFVSKASVGGNTPLAALGGSSHSYNNGKDQGEVRTENDVQKAWQAFKSQIQGPAGGSMQAASVSSYEEEIYTGGAGSSMTVAAAVTAAAAVANAVRSEESRVAEVSRAASAQRMGRELATRRAELKQHVSWATLALGPVMAVVPGGEPLRSELDKLLVQLEEVSPTDKPLNIQVDAPWMSTVDPLSPPQPQPDPVLLGSWTLVYASTVDSDDSVSGIRHNTPSSLQASILAQMLQLADTIPGIGMDAIVQKLGTDRARPGVITLENSATFSFGPLGTWRVAVTGTWLDNGGGMCSEAMFNFFTTKPLKFMGINTEALPEVIVAVPEGFRSQGTWCTTYLDTDMRISRGSNGSIFLFKRMHEEPIENNRSPPRAIGNGKSLNWPGLPESPVASST